MRWLALAALAVLFVVGGIAIDQTSSQPKPTPVPVAAPTRLPTLVPTVVPTQAPTATPGWTRPSIGTEARVEPQSGNNRLAVAVSAEALDALSKAAGARDSMGFDQLMRTRGYWVTRGTRVLILDHGFEETQFRILDGDHAGRVGWTVPQNLRP